MFYKILNFLFLFWEQFRRYHEGSQFVAQNTRRFCHILKKAKFSGHILIRFSNLKATKGLPLREELFHLESWQDRRKHSS
jgi:hypothetical protein